VLGVKDYTAMSPSRLRRRRCDPNS
jgi:hypothetical protein